MQLEDRGRREANGRGEKEIKKKGGNERESKRVKGGSVAPVEQREGPR